jgi:hypothetical protein
MLKGLEKIKSFPLNMVARGMTKGKEMDRTNMVLLITMVGGIQGGGKYKWGPAFFHEHFHKHLFINTFS